MDPELDLDLFGIGADNFTQPPNSVETGFRFEPVPHTQVVPSSEPEAEPLQSFYPSEPNQFEDAFLALFGPVTDSNAQHQSGKLPPNATSLSEESANGLSLIVADHFFDFDAAATPATEGTTVFRDSNSAADQETDHKVGAGAPCETVSSNEAAANHETFSSEREVNAHFEGFVNLGQYNNTRNGEVDRAFDGSFDFGGFEDVKLPPHVQAELDALLYSATNDAVVYEHTVPQQPESRFDATNGPLAHEDYTEPQQPGSQYEVINISDDGEFHSSAFCATHILTTTEESVDGDDAVASLESIAPVQDPVSPYKYQGIPLSAGPRTSMQQQAQMTPEDNHSAPSIPGMKYLGENTYKLCSPMAERQYNLIPVPSSPVPSIQVAVSSVYSQEDPTRPAKVTPTANQASSPRKRFRDDAQAAMDATPKKRARKGQKPAPTPFTPPDSYRPGPISELFSKKVPLGERLAKQQAILKTNQPAVRRSVETLMRMKFKTLHPQEKARLLLPLLKGIHPLDAERQELADDASYGAIRQREVLENAAFKSDMAAQSAQLAEQQKLAQQQKQVQERHVAQVQQLDHQQFAQQQVDQMQQQQVPRMHQQAPRMREQVSSMHDQVYNMQQQYQDVHEQVTHMLPQQQQLYVMYQQPSYDMYQ
jgi:hypothetical protein